MHGSHRCPMGDSQAKVAIPAAAAATRPTVARCTASAERGTLDFTYRRPLARPAGPLSPLSDLPSSLSAVAARRDADAPSAPVGRRPARERQVGPLGDFHRRQLLEREKGGSAVGPTRRGKRSKIMAIADRHGLPLAASVASASPHETRLVEATLAQRFVRSKPEKMIGDAAYDSDGLDQQWHQRHGVELIAPHRSNRRKRKTQDGRVLRRYCRRWKIERLFAWLHNFRRLVTRWEYLRGQLPRHGPTRLPRDPLEAFMRWVVFVWSLTSRSAVNENNE